MIFLAIITGSIIMLIGILVGHALNNTNNKTAITVKKEPL